jgi:HK97 family phage portal protein
VKAPAIVSRLFGGIRTKGQSLSPVGSWGGGWLGVIRESFSGAFQAAIEIDAPRSILAFSAVFSCVTLIASDIAKLCIDLTLEDANDICTRAPADSPYWSVLRKPNRYQNRIKFIEQWLISKLLFGNTYILKGRDASGIVTALYILDAQRVTPLVSDSGDVYYQLSADHLAGIMGQITVPASEIIHDRINCLWHPLVGISPIYACGMSATTGNRIQSNSATFFQNMSRPSGMLSAPGTIPDTTAQRLKAEFEQNFGGNKIGRLAVLGDGLKYEAMTITAVDAQLIEQLKWTVEDVARCFHVPLFKIGAETGRATGNLSVEAQQQLYLNDCLHIHIQDVELCLDEGLDLPPELHAEIDEEGLLRMDTAARYIALGEAIKGMWMAPNEARKREGMKPVEGGDSPLAQQQNYSLAALAKRDALADPFGSHANPAPAQLPAPAPAAAASADGAQAAAKAAELLDYIAKGLACST